MRKKTIRILAMLLAAVIFCAVPASVSAADGYTLVSTKGTAIQYPYDDLYYPYALPCRAVVKVKNNNNMYIMPKAENGHGNLGQVKSGTEVTLLGEKNGYYFFLTDDGRMGWNGKKFFTDVTELTELTGRRVGYDGLTDEDLVEVSEFILHYDAGIASSKFYADRAVVVLKQGRSTSVTIHGKFKNYAYLTMYGDSASASWNGGVRNNRASLSLKGLDTGITVFEMSNYTDDQVFYIMVIVV